MADALTSALQENFGFNSFRLGQAEAIRNLLNDLHTLVVMPTGAGKSLIYQLVALQRKGITLVISPLIALMKDQVDSLRNRNIPATYINSALPATEQSRRLAQLAQGQYKIVYVAPERLRSVAFLDAIRYQKVSLLAVDEAHCVSEWGHDFRPDYLNIAQARTTFGNPLTVALTATATPKVQTDIIRQLGLGESVARIVTGFNRPNLSLNVRYTSGLAAKLKALRDLYGRHTAGAILIYTGTRRDAEEVAEFTKEIVKLPAEFYHAGLPSDERTRIQESFMQGRLHLVAATNAFGMGIDRADVRQVIHYSMPGSLEAYYQEAGRAGRDGLSAQATLLYDPQDRALQEFFIQQSVLTGDDLHAIYHAVQTGENWLTEDDLSGITGLHPVQVRIGLAELERAGAFEHLGDEGYRALFRKGAWKQPEIDRAIYHNKLHLDQRKSQLKGIVHYAEANSCRRKIILQYFGDTDSAEAEDCCDNCRIRQPVLAVGATDKKSKPAAGMIEQEEYSGNTGPGTPGNLEKMTQGERAALIILDCVKRLKSKVGRKKLAQVLHGSTVPDMHRFHYDKNVYYARLAAVKQSDIERLIIQLIDQSYLKAVGGEYPVLTLSPLGENALEQKSAIALDLPESFLPKNLKRSQAKRAAGGSLAYTAQLISNGLTPEQIAEERGLAPWTIYGHLAQLIERGEVEVERVVPGEVRWHIEQAIQQVGSTELLSPIKALLPEKITYSQIRCVVSAFRATEGSKPAPINPQPVVPQSDVVELYLGKPHPRPLTGPWQCGWALGFHSRFSGGDWSRSGVGDLAYRLKYESDLSTLPALVEQAQAVMAAHPELAQVDAILPVPPSTPRPTEPVQAFCAALSVKIQIPVKALAVKTRQTQPQKELKTLAQKRTNVSGAFTLSGSVAGKRILIVDDLYDSGATLNELTRLLLKNGAACVHVLTLTRTIHSDL